MAEPGLPGANGQPADFDRWRPRRAGGPVCRRARAGPRRHGRRLPRHDLKHERQVAIKILHAELAAALGAERFLREIRIAAGLQHRTSCHSTTPARPAAASFRDALRRGGTPPRSHRERAAPVARGMRSGSHGEVADGPPRTRTSTASSTATSKPENILISGRPRPSSRISGSLRAVSEAGAITTDGDRARAGARPAT